MGPFEDWPNATLREREREFHSRCRWCRHQESDNQTAKELREASCVKEMACGAGTWLQRACLPTLVSSSNSSSYHNYSSDASGASAFPVGRPSSAYGLGVLSSSRLFQGLGVVRQAGGVRGRRGKRGVFATLATRPEAAEGTDGAASNVLLEVKGLTAVVADSGKEILRGVDLVIRVGEVRVFFTFSSGVLCRCVENQVSRVSLLQQRCRKKLSS